MEIPLVKLDPNVFIHPEYWAEKKQRAAALRTDAEVMDKQRREEDENWMRGNH